MLPMSVIFIYVPSAVVFLDTNQFAFNHSHEHGMKAWVRKIHSFLTTMLEFSDRLVWAIPAPKICSSLSLLQYFLVFMRGCHLAYAPHRNRFCFDVLLCTASLFKPTALVVCCCRFLLERRVIRPSLLQYECVEHVTGRLWLCTPNIMLWKTLIHVVGCPEWHPMASSNIRWRICVRNFSLGN